jgi:hypothetical protein
MPIKAESGSAAFLLFLNVPYLTQLMKASQRYYQTYQENFVNKLLLSIYSPDFVPLSRTSLTWATFLLSSIIDRFGLFLPRFFLPLELLESRLLSTYASLPMLAYAGIGQYVNNLG